MRADLYLLFARIPKLSTSARHGNISHKKKRVNPSKKTVQGVNKTMKDRARQFGQDIYEEVDLSPKFTAILATVTMQIPRFCRKIRVFP